ncbi:MAG: hypothetical protein JNL18_22920 [Planctomycetaceae bacterium]|nr:hypothetical protein [Planctomycetaceae bacterium]
MRMLSLCLCTLYFAIPSYASSLESASLLSGYLPGQPQSFIFSLPPVTDLGSYNVELLLTSPTGVAGTDFYFDALATTPAANNYIFSSAENFFVSANVVPGNIHSLTLSDFSSAGVDVVTGANDEVASIVLRTSASFNGVLSLSLGVDTFQLDTPASTPTSVSEYASALAAAVAEVNSEVSPVPEPGTAGICIASTLLVGYRLRRSRTPQWH